MKSTLSEVCQNVRLPREVQLKRLRKVIREELPPIQREVLLAYYIQQQTIPEIARQRGVHKSTVARTLHRAENNLRKYLAY